MKRTLRVILLMLVLSSSIIFARGSKEIVEFEKTIRIAEQMPGLITPGVWDGQVFSMNGSIYEYLIEMNAETGELEPLLATAWETGDGSTWEFTLRKGVKFHDGSDFDAQDVKYTIEMKEHKIRLLDI